LLSGVSFALEEGRIVGMIGPNGAGKSTTMKLILGIIKPDQGKLSLKEIIGYLMTVKLIKRKSLYPKNLL